MPRRAKSARDLSAESVDGSALSLEGVNNVEGGDSLPAGVFGVGDRVADYSLEEGLENSAGLLVDESGDSLDSSTAGETADCRLGDSLDVVPKDFAVALGSSLAESLSSFSSSGHDVLVSLTCEKFLVVANSKFGPLNSFWRYQHAYFRKYECFSTIVFCKVQS